MTPDRMYAWTVYRGAGMVWRGCWKGFVTWGVIGAEGVGGGPAGKVLGGATSLLEGGSLRPLQLAVSEPGRVSSESDE